MTIENKNKTQYKDYSKSEISDYQIISFVSLQEFESWQEQNHSTTNGIWLRIF